MDVDDGVPSDDVVQEEIISGSDGNQSIVVIQSGSMETQDSAPTMTNLGHDDSGREIPTDDDEEEVSSSPGSPTITELLDPDRVPPFQDQSLPTDLDVPPAQVQSLTTEPDVTESMTSISELRIRLKQALDECASYRTEVSLLNEEIENYSKTQRSQRDELKRVTSQKDNLQRELSKHTGMRRYVSFDDKETHIKSQQEEIGRLRSKLSSLQQSVFEAAEELSDAAMAVDIGSDRRDESSSGCHCDMSDDNQFANASRRMQQGTSHQLYSEKLKKTPRTPTTPTPAAPGIESDNTHRIRRQEVNVFGSSLSRGVGLKLTQRGMDATSFTYPGAYLPELRRKVAQNVRTDRAADQIVLQGGGNDCEKYPVHLVKKEYVRLINETRRVAPESHIVLSKIPKRRFNRHVNRNIDQLNAFIEKQAEATDGVSCVDIRPAFPSMFGNDKVHFNKKGKDFYGDRLASELINFQAVSMNYLQ